MQCRQCTKRALCECNKNCSEYEIEQSSKSIRLIKSKYNKEYFEEVFCD